MAPDKKITPKASCKNDDRTVLLSEKLSDQRKQPPKNVIKAGRHVLYKADTILRKNSDDATRAVIDDKVSSSPKKSKIGEFGTIYSRSSHQNQKDFVETEYTEYNTEGNSSNSSGFKKAKAIAKRALATKGNILKKRFVLEDVLGEGGMGIVYRARDLRKVEAEDPNPFVAAKVLSQGFKDHPDAFVVMQQEAVKSQQLAHPNIVTVHDFDRDGNTIYLTMELLQGHPLDKLIRSHKKKGIPKDQAIAIFKDLCAALSYAHERQLIHADFKPGNVFVTDEGTAKVLDFGIARAASKESQKHKYDVGKLGAITTAYSTVEMERGITPTFSDDVYALACVLYEMLSGKHPFQRKSAAVALKENIEPQRIDTLTTKQWKTLSVGLALKRKNRFATISEFINAFFPSKNFSITLKVAGVIIFTSLCVAAWLGYKQHQSKQQLTNTIAKKLEQSQYCYDTKDYECAIEQSLAVTGLDPNNMKAKQLYINATQSLKDTQLKKKVFRFLSQAKSCFGKQDLSCAIIKIQELLALEPNNIEALAMRLDISKASHTKNISKLVLQGKECIERNDLNCALLFLGKVQKLDSEHELSKSLENDVKTLQQQLKNESLNRKKAISLFVNKANDCLSMKDYDCTIEQANHALKIDGSNIDSIRLRSEAELAKAQQKLNKKKVATLVRQGRECFQKGNFNCAVAKAVSALDILPDNDAALKLKKSSIDRQNKLKQSLKIN